MASVDSTNAELLDMFTAMLPTQISEKGFYPFPALAVGPSGGITMLALACDYGSALAVLHETIIDSDAVELVAGLDMYALPEQPNEFADFLAVFRWREGAGWNYGVMDYQPPPREIILRDIDWERDYWKDQLQLQHRAIIRRKLGMRLTPRRQACSRL